MQNTANTLVILDNQALAITATQHCLRKILGSHTEVEKWEFQSQRDGSLKIKTTLNNNGAQVDLHFISFVPSEHSSYTHHVIFEIKKQFHDIHFGYSATEGREYLFVELHDFQSSAV